MIDSMGTFLSDDNSPSNNKLPLSNKGASLYHFFKHFGIKNLGKTTKICVFPNCLSLNRPYWRSNPVKTDPIGDIVESATHCVRQQLV